MNQTRAFCRRASAIRARIRAYSKSDEGLFLRILPRPRRDHIQLLITRCRGSLEVARPRGRMKSPMASPRAWQTRSTLRSPRRAPRPWMPGARRTPTSGSTWAKRTWGRANWPRPNRKGVSYVLSATSVTTTFVAFFMLHSALPTLAVGNLVLGCREPGGIAPRLCLRVGRDSDG
jgi:hypothetical protein